jgi:pseudouridine kinase
MVIGGAVVDLSTRPLEGRQLLPGTSNPGTLFQSFGGVGRNIAEAAARLGARVGLLSAIADDAMGKSLLEHCLSTGIDTKYMKVVSNEDGKQRTATYSAVLDADGQLHVAIADMRVSSCTDHHQAAITNAFLLLSPRS